MEFANPNQQEIVFYEDPNVFVTNSRFVCLGKTYAMRNISSVAIHRIEKTKAGAIGAFIFGLLLTIGSHKVEMKLAGLTIGLLGIYFFKKIKDEYAIRVSSNSGETNALVSQDENYIQKIVAAVNEAIIYRG